MPKDKYGNRLTWKEFGARWREGIEGITPQQKIKVQIGGTRIILIGLILGLAVSLYGYQRLWWMAIVLSGALIVTSVQYIGLEQQKIVFDKIDAQFADPEESEILNPDRQLIR